MNKLTCTKCQETKPLAEFYKASTTTRGYRYNCKLCEAVYQRDWNKSHPGYKHLSAKAYRQANRKKESARTKAWYKSNPEKAAAGRESWYKANRAKAIANARNWRLANPKATQKHNRNNQHKRRALKQNNGVFKVTSKDIKRMLARPCAYCADGSTHIDHIIPLSRGGGHSIGNLTGACASCNLSKGAKFITEWKRAKK